MAVRKKILVLTLAAGFAVPAIAQTALEKQLAAVMGVPPSESGKPKGKKSPPVKPSWNVPNDGSKKDAPCSMSYRDGANVMGYIGPFKGWNESYFFVAGPNVPFANWPRKLRVALANDGDANQTVQAFNYPAGNNQYALLFKLINFAEALDVMDDSENVAVLLMEESDFKYKQAIFSGSWTGGHAAREKLRACIEKKKSEFNK